MILGDLVDAGVAELRTGPFGTQLRASDYVSSGRPVLNVRNIGFGEVRSEKLEFIDEKTADRLSGHLLQDGDIVFGRKGAVERHAFIRGPYIGALQGSDCIRLRLGPAAPVRAEFATFALRTREHQEWMKSFCSHGATMASLNQDILRQVRLPDIPLPNQDAIVSVLRALDDLIENSRRRVEVLEEMARAIYREWFVHFRYPGHERVPLVDSALGPIPEGWEVLPSSQALQINPKVALKRGTKCRYVAMRDLDEHWMHCGTSDWRDSPTGSKFVNGDTLFARITPCLENGKTGFVQFLEEGEAACGSTEFVVLRGQKVGPAFTYLLARNPEFRGHAVASMSGASGRQRVRNECFDSYLVATPPRPISQKFEQAVRPLFELGWSLHQQAAELGSLCDLILPRLVTGQIDVSSLDLDGLVGAVS